MLLLNVQELMMGFRCEKLNIIDNNTNNNSNTNNSNNNNNNNFLLSLSPTIGIPLQKAYPRGLG